MPRVLIFDIDEAGGHHATGLEPSRDVRLVGRLRAAREHQPGATLESGRSAVLVLRAHSRPAHRTTGQLTRRELDVVRLLADGDSTRDIALRLSYSERTVKNIVRDLQAKLNGRTRAHAVALATRQGLI